MKAQFSKLALAAALGLALTFTLSCSSDNDNGGGSSPPSGGSSSSGVGNSSSGGNLGGSSSSGVGNSSSGGNLGDTFKDPRDNQTYKTIKIGTQTWMAENLNYDVPNNDTDVCYDNDPANCTTYGRLYDWATAMTECPPGWYLPSNAEWTALANYVGSNAGTKLKATSGWKDKNDGSSGNGTDIYGFAALPGGYCNSSGRFFGVDDQGTWWSSTETSTDKDKAYLRYMSYSNETFNWDTYYKSSLRSVRCVELPPPCDPLTPGCVNPF